MLINIMKNRLRFLVLATSLVLPVASLANDESRQTKFGVAAGGLFLSGDFSSPGVITSGFGELRMSSSVDLRVDVSYAELPIRFGGRHTAEPDVFSVRAPDGSDPVQLAGGGISVLFLGDSKKFGRSYFVLGAGGYYGRQGEKTRTGLVVGPGFGWTIGGSIKAGIELNAQVAIFDSSTIIMVPVRLLVRF